MSGSSFRYETIARELSDAIRQGTYQPGSRMPSVRQICRQYEVSLGTALQAFRVLENAGLLSARPKSGFYVQSQTFTETDGEPVPSRPPPEPTPVTGGRLTFSVLSTFRDPKLLRLGTTATPSEDLLPLKALGRILSGVARRDYAATATYGDPAGHLGLRAQIARRIAEAGCYCSPDEIVITNGCQESVVLSLGAVAQAGDTIAIESPTFYGILHAIESLGMRALEVPTHPREGVDLDALETLIQQQVIKACVLMPSCQNPLGASMSTQNKRRLMALLAEANIPLIEDDALGELTFTRPRPKAAKAFDETGNSLYCGSFSKTLGPGYRLGWIVPGRHWEPVVYLKAVTNVHAPILSQVTLAEFLGGGGYTRCVNRAVRQYQQRAGVMRQWIRDFFPIGTRVTNPESGFLLWVELPSDINGVELYRRSLTKGIGIAPGIIFSPTDSYVHHIRLSCAGIADAVEAQQAVQIVGRIAKDMLE